MTSAAAHEGEHLAEGLIAKAAKGWLRKSLGAAGWQAAKDAGKTGAKDLEKNAVKDTEKDLAKGATGHVGENARYEFDQITNPGPLGTGLRERGGREAANFAGGKYDRIVAEHDMILFRGGDSERELGRYFTTDPPFSEIGTRIDNAVEKFWTDGEGRYLSTANGGATSVIDTGYAVFIPKGTEMFKGPVASRGRALVGGAKDQIFIGDISKLHAVDRWPLG